MKKYSKGFTLIELLVVIAIIGILSSVVLASLSTARNKGSDAAVKAALTQLRATGELVASDSGTGSYANIFASSTAIMANVTSNALSGAGSVATSSSSSGWAASAALKGGGAWCVDSTGVSRGTNVSGSAYSATASLNITSNACN